MPEQMIVETTIKKDESGVLLSLEELIKSHISSIERLKDEVRKYKEMLDSTLENDAVYQSNLKTAKEAAKVKNQTKAEIMKQPSNVSITQKVNSMKTELREKQLALSDYLLEYHRMTGATQLELFPGQTYEIVQTAKVLRKVMFKKN